uniref:Putative conserved secreted protein n=1 Tax=Panstrongylus lignarius TaxID=156445 RepID=A0A224XZD0_9HEMI
MALTNILTATLIAFILAVVVPYPAAGTERSWFGSDCGNNKSHNFEFGSKGYFDKLLYTDHVQEEGKWMRKISKDVTYPAVGQQPVGYITYMEILDQYVDGNGGCAFVQNGGVGLNTVTLHIKSQRSGGFNFIINIYGLDNACVKK